MTVILDYGMGNLRSVENVFKAMGGGTAIQTDLSGASRLVIPGVGAFGAAMERLSPLASDIRKAAADGLPILGICLGQQLLFDRSEEFGEHSGLGLIGGDVTYFPKGLDVKVPHVGWNSLCYRRHDGIATGGESGEQVYFVHSLVTRCSDPSTVVATSEHGIEFASIVGKGNVWGCQFHPEKSGAVGLRLLRNFLAC